MSVGWVGFGGALEAKLVKLVHPERPDLGFWLGVKNKMHSRHLQWKIDHGLAVRGRPPEGWKPDPKGLMAKFFVKVRK